MASRRDFLTTALAVGVAAPSSRPALAPGSERTEIKSALGRPIGLQLWSLREQLPKDLAGTLARVRALGFREVEGAGLWGRTPRDLRAALDAAGLRCQSAHMDFERLRDDLASALEEVRALGASWVVCPWIPHEGPFTREGAQQAGEAFNRFGNAAHEAGLRFGYHCHGYEFLKAGAGTLFDLLAQATDPARVAFQIDVFHAYRGGADPARLITQHKDRVTMLHLKDIKKGFPVEAGSSGAPAAADVPVGTGQIDYPAVFRAALSSAAFMYYLEDESADPLGHIPRSLAYLENLKL